MHYISVTYNPYYDTGVKYKVFNEYGEYIENYISDETGMVYCTCREDIECSNCKEKLQNIPVDCTEVDGGAFRNHVRADFYLDSPKKPPSEKK